MFANRTQNRFFASTKHQQQNGAMTLDAIREIAPSAFAVEKHESRSERYTYIPTAAVIDAMMKEGYQAFAAAQGGSRIVGKENFTKHLIRFRHPETSVVKHDSVPEIVLINSHDGTSAYKVMSGVFRIVCTNGLIVADSTVGAISVSHKGNVVEEVVLASFEIIKQTKQTTAKIDQWSGITLEAGEQKALATSAHVMRFGDEDGNVPSSVAVKPEQLLQPRREEDKRDDLWTVFNRVQENAVRGGVTGYAADSQGRQRRRTTREISGIDQNVKLNRAMWMLAEQMEQLKTANV